MPRPLWIEKALSAQSALNTIRVFRSVLGSKAEGTLIITTFGAGTSVGQVVVEDANNFDYPGTWAIVATINWVAANQAHSTFVSGSFIARRVRISTGIVGGTVDVDVQVTG